MQTPVFLTESFIKKVKILTLDVYRRTKDDPTMYRTKERVMTICDLDPTKVIDRIGKVLYKYCEPIMNSDDSFFIDSDRDKFKSDITMDNFNDFSTVVDKISDIYFNITEAERQVYREIFFDMLEIYLDYRVQVQQVQ